MTAFPQALFPAFSLRVRSQRWLRVFAVSVAVTAAVSCFAQVQGDPQPNFDTLAQSATAAREGGNPEQAIPYYQRALEVRPEWQEGWWYLGVLEYGADRFRDAIPSFKRVVQLNPNLGLAWSLLGLCEFETTDYENSLRDLQKGREVGNADDAEIARVSAYHLGMLQNRSGEFEKGFEILSASFEGEIPEQVKTALGLSLLRVPLLPKEVDPSKDALVEASGEIASMFAKGDSVNGLNSFRTLLRKYPDTPYLHYSFGIHLASVGRNDEALIAENQESEISPDSELPYLEVNLLYLRLHLTNEALEAAKRAIHLAPNNPVAHEALAKALESVGRKKEAEAEYRAEKALPPDKPVRELRLLTMYASSAAAGESTTQTSSESSSVEYFFQQASALQSDGKNDEAIRTYQQGLRSHPEWNDGWWNLGMLAYSTRNYPEAITALKVCAERNFGGGTAWAVMGLSEFAIKDYSNALIHLQRGQNLGMSGSAESIQLARYQLAVLLTSAGQFARADSLLASVANSGALAKEVQFALGLTLLHIPSRPEQVEASKTKMVLAAGEVAGFLHESKYDEALPRLKILLQEYSATPFLHYAYGMALADLSQYDEAESQLRQEITISERSELPYLRLAEIALKTRRTAEALSLAQRAVQLRDDSAEAHYLVGRSHLELGQGRGAMEELERAAKLAPESPEIHFNLAKAYAQANLQQKAQEERATFTRLNSAAEEQRSQNGSQSYSGSHENVDVSHSDTPAAKPADPDRH